MPANITIISAMKVRTQVPRYSGLKLDDDGGSYHAFQLSDTKYRDIADGKQPCFLFLASLCVV